MLFSFFLTGSRFSQSLFPITQSFYNHNTVHTKTNEESQMRKYEKAIETTTQEWRKPFRRITRWCRRLHSHEAQFNRLFIFPFSQHSLYVSFIFILSLFLLRKIRLFIHLTPLNKMNTDARDSNSYVFILWFYRKRGQEFFLFTPKNGAIALTVFLNAVLTPVAWRLFILLEWWVTFFFLLRFVRKWKINN